MFLTNVPEIQTQTIEQDMYRLLQEADECDHVHDVIFKVGKKVFPAHRFVLSRCSRESLDFEKELIQKAIIELPDIHPEIFQQFLLYNYTGTCDLLMCQKCPVELEKLFKNIENSSTEEKNRKTNSGKTKDPVRMLQECAKRLGFQSLQKRLEDFYYHNGYIKCRSEKRRYSEMLKFDKTLMPEFCDVIVKVRNKKELSAHKCILVARTEYFNNLFSMRWTEDSVVEEISLPFSYTVVERFLEFLYTDELTSIENEEIEHVCNLLILADEYFIERLKQICEYVLSTHITLKNVAQMFSFSDIYNAKQLSKCCMEFICLNLSALLESRSLDDVDENLLKDLTDYYCEWNPVLQQRVITPYSTAPSDDVIIEAGKSCTYLENESEYEVKPKVPKKKSKSYKSIIPTSKNLDADKENTVTKEDSSEPIVPNVETVDNQRKSPSTPVRIQAISSALKQMEMESVTTEFTYLSKSDTSLSNFPELGSPPSSGTFSKSPKSGEKFEVKGKMTRLSQKQRKRLSSESSSKPVVVEAGKYAKDVNGLVVVVNISLNCMLHIYCSII